MPAQGAGANPSRGLLTDALSPYLSHPTDTGPEASPELANSAAIPSRPLKNLTHIHRASINPADTRRAVVIVGRCAWLEAKPVRVGTSALWEQVLAAVPLRLSHSLWPI